jgi:RNA polymerase sporulation-specific sigma factor
MADNIEWEGLKMPLTPEEERRLFQEMMEGKEAKKRLETENALNEEEKGKLEELVKKGEVARKELILSLGPLIYYIATKRLHKSDDKDLIQEGWKAASKAVNAYDPNKRARLVTYAHRKIEGAMRNYLKKENRKKTREISLDKEPKGQEGEMLESPVPPLVETFFEDKILLDQAISQLPEGPKDLKEVIMKKYIYEETDREIAEQMGVSPATISRWEKEALEELREILGVEIQKEVKKT